MKPLACRYSIVQLVPYAETGEFANIGVVLTCPQTGFFNFMLQSKKSKRVTDFFGALDRGFYKSAVRAVEEELSRIRTAAHLMPVETKANALRGVINALVRPREAMVRFSPARVLLTTDPAKELKKKFEHYVDHSFATPEYVEHTMNARLRDLLNGLQLNEPFRPAKIGTEVVSAKFDFVQMVDGDPKKVIKALNLSQNDVNDIAAHGDVWTGKLSRLIKQNALPRATLVNVTLPADNKPAHQEVSMEIVAELSRQEIVVIPGAGATAMQKIREFAKA